MAHLGVVYRFMLREPRKPESEYRLLGSIDGKGTRFCDIGPGLLKKIIHLEDVKGLDAPQPSVTFRSEVEVEGDHLFGAIFNHHEYGTRGVLNRHHEGDVTPFSEVDNQQVEVAVVVSAPPMRRVGFIALHVPNRRGVKTGIEAELRRMLQEEYEVYIELEPVVPLDAVEAAIELQGLGSVSFRKLDNPTGLFEAEDSWWTDGRELAGVELRLNPKRSGRLMGQKLLGFIRTNKATLRADEAPVKFSELVTIGAHTYDELSVEVYLAGRKKVMRVNSDGHSMSNAFSWELDVEPAPTHGDLVRELTRLVPD